MMLIDEILQLDGKEFHWAVTEENAPKLIAEMVQLKWSTEMKSKTFKGGRNRRWLDIKQQKSLLKLESYGQAPEISKFLMQKYKFTALDFISFDYETGHKVSYGIVGRG